MEEYAERNLDIYGLYDETDLSYQAIGDMYGISRERVRQVLIKQGIELHGSRRSIRRREYILENVETTPISKMGEHLGLNYDTMLHLMYRMKLSYVPDPDSKPVIHWFVNQCISRGMAGRATSKKHGYNAMVNGHRIEVCYGTPRNYTGSPRPIHLFNLATPRGPIGELVDFVAAIFYDTAKVFIIPISALNHNHQCLGIVWPNTYNFKPKYADYFEAWHLLEAK